MAIYLKAFLTVKVKIGVALHRGTTKIPSTVAETSYFQVTNNQQRQTSHLVHLSNIHICAYVQFALLETNSRSPDDTKHHLKGDNFDNKSHDASGFDYKRLNLGQDSTT